MNPTHNVSNVAVMSEDEAMYTVKDVWLVMS